ncbi:MAG: glutamate--tRNA ligase, partial [Clostridia bacterium]|nr:glutamate--tRNA ligase [Clostridia bacterium]
EYTKSALAIDRDVPKPRKDIAKWNEAKDYLSYFYEELYVPCRELPESISAADAKAFLEEYKNVYDPNDDRQGWFDRIKALCPALGFAAETKEYKADPTAFKGSAGDLSTVLRIAVTGRRNTPDLCSIMRVLGKERCIARIDAMINSL